MGSMACPISSSIAWVPWSTSRHNSSFTPSGAVCVQANLDRRSDLAKSPRQSLAHSSNLEAISRHSPMPLAVFSPVANTSLAKSSN